MERLELDACVVDLQTGKLSGGRDGALTHRELQLLRHLVDHAGRDVTREALIAEFGYRPLARSRAVDKAVYSLRSKVEASPGAPDHLLTVPGGYRLVLRERRPEAPPERAVGSLPRERDAFVGRGQDLERLARHLREGRLVTLTGPGGVGKTRLVVHYAAACGEAWPGGIVSCDLSEARTEEGLAFGVARALGVRLGPGDPAEQLGHVLAGRGACLVVLDNLEQVVEPARALLSRWLDRAPEATLLVTSRSVLGVTGERVLPLDVLPSSDAAELFVLRAEALRDGFVAEHGDDPAVRALVERLDGLPLAIELAAARSRVLSPGELLERLADRFRLLGRRDRDDRHGTLRATLDWSWNLLEPWAAATLTQLTVFEGGFDLEAVEAVLDLSAFEDAPWAPDALQALVDRSLVAPRGDRRFGLLRSIQAHAAEKLGAAERQAAEERHGAHFARLGTDDALRALRRPGGVRRRANLARELDNLVVAASRAVARGDAVVAVAAALAAWEVLGTSGPFAAVIPILHGPLALPLGPRDRVRLLDRAGRACDAIGRVELARTHLEDALALAQGAGLRAEEGDALVQLSLLDLLSGPERVRRGRSALDLFRAQGDVDGEAHALWCLARLEVGLDPPEARGHCEAALAIVRRVGDRSQEALVLNTMAVVECTAGDAAEAMPWLEAAAAANLEVGNDAARGRVLLNQGVVHFELGDLEASIRCTREALPVLRDAGLRALEGLATSNLATFLRMAGRPTEASPLYHAAIAIVDEVRNERESGSARLNLGILLLSAGRPDEARAWFDAALAIAQRADDRDVQARILTALGRLHRLGGRFAEAHAALQQALAMAESVGRPTPEALVLVEASMVSLAEGRIEDARQALDEAERRFGPDILAIDRVVVHGARARIELRGGSPARAAAERAEGLRLHAALGGANVELSEWLGDERS